jgi:hypothetical protein
LGEDHRSRAGEARPGDTAADADDPEVSRSRVPFMRWFVIGGPVGLGIGLVLSMWVAQLVLDYSAVVQVEPQWIAGEELAMRTQVALERPAELGGVRTEATVVQGGASFELPTLESAGRAGIAQGRFRVPELAPGPAELLVTLYADGIAPRSESVPIEVVAARDPRAPTPIVSGSTLQYGDDSEPQPLAVKIDVRPYGRLLAGFPNRLLVRVTDAFGKPWSGPIEVLLADGELAGKKGDPRRPVLLVRGRTDAAGLIEVDGELTSEVLRIEVRTMTEADPTKVAHRRRIRMVSFAGAVTLVAEPDAIATGGSIELTATALSQKQAIHVDVHGADGAFVDTLQPPAIGREPPRPWDLSTYAPGVLAFEGIGSVNAPGESTATALVLVCAHAIDDRRCLEPLLDLQRQRLDVPRIERDFSRTLEKNWLDRIGSTALSADAMASARTWLLGTMPPMVYSPPVALSTRERDLAAVAARKRFWRNFVRVFFLGGGGLFIAVMVGMMVRAQSRMVAETAAELARLHGGEVPDDVAQQVRAARRTALLRGWGIVTVMVAALLMTVYLMEHLMPVR